MSNDFAYDKVRYPAQVYPKLHPARLGAIARLHGVPVASPRSCRLLEVGCGDGLGLITLAMAYPQSSFIGVDLSNAAIERGNAQRDALGLDNLTLLAADLLEWDPGDRPYDYVIAHGFYSWVPQVVRERLLALCNQAMAPGGIACISYNALPGCHMRRMLWEMLKFHTGGIHEPAARIAAAQEFLQLLKSGLPEGSLYATTMTGEIDELSGRLDPNVLFHDDLAEINDPFTLDQFLKHAHAHDLGFVAEANYHEMSTRTAHERVRPLLDDIASDDLATKEQYLDFFTGRRFRQTILCRKSAMPSATQQASAIASLQLASALQPDEGGADEAGRVRFSLPTAGGVVTDNPVVQAMLRDCVQAYPSPQPVRELFDLASGQQDSVNDDALERACQFIGRAFAVGIVELHCDGPAFANEAGALPLASPLARLQAARGENRVTSLRPSTVDMEDPATRALLLALDGTRDRQAIVAFVTDALAQERTVDAEDRDLPGADELERHLEYNLLKMAKLGLLVDRPG
ncbi:MAG: class I SAM-dependent methyltransferase [Thermomonas sp.]